MKSHPYPALIRALNALWDLPSSPLRQSCMDALVVMIDDFESQSRFEAQPAGSEQPLRRVTAS